MYVAPRHTFSNFNHDRLIAAPSHIKIGPPRKNRLHRCTVLYSAPQSHLGRPKEESRSFRDASTAICLKELTEKLTLITYIDTLEFHFPSK